MSNLNQVKAGLCLAALLGGLHLAWALLVASGWAQIMTDFILRLHFIQLDYVIEQFNVSTALLLVAITASIGYVVGWGFARLWNALHK